MKLTQRIRTLTILAGALLLVALLPVVASAQAKTHAGKSFAQKLVEATQAKHPEVDEVGISTDTRRGCYGIASTDKSDIGEKCENGGSNSVKGQALRALRIVLALLDNRREESPLPCGVRTV